MDEVVVNEQAPFRTYADAVSWIVGLMPFGIRPGLKRLEWMMDRLGNPHLRLKFIHVAGTNGKGSTCAYISRVLLANGYSVGTFTSPYITKFTDRIAYNLQDIEEEHVLMLTNRIKPLADELAASELGSPTMFEICTVLAILYYATVTYPDFVVFEAGLGGRLDSTNIVLPIVSIITNIGHDHTDVLGDTLDKIAVEKAGIIKPGVPVITAADQPETISVIKRAATDKKSTVYSLGDHYRYESVKSEENEQVFHFVGPFRTYEQVTITLNGAHQMKNAAAALMALEVMRQYYAVVLEDDQVYEGMKAAAWPGRLEIVSDAPRMLLDGAHNPEGAETLADALRHTFRRQKLRLMIGMLAAKHHRSYMQHILPLADTLIVTEPDWRKKLPAGELAQIARDMSDELGLDSVEIIVEPNWRTALSKLKDMTGPDDLAVVSGTLYLISDVRSAVLHQTDSEKGW